LPLAFGPPIMRSMPAPGNAGCCMREIAVPWNDCVAVVELGLWSMLSTAAVEGSGVLMGVENSVTAGTNVPHVPPGAATVYVQ